MKKLSILILCFVLTFGIIGACGKKKPIEQIFEDDKLPEASIAVDNRNMDKVISSPTFAVNESVPNASTLEELSVNPLFASGMVLQQKAVNCVFGTTMAMQIAVKFDDVFYYGKVVKGNFEVYLPTMEADNSKHAVTVYTENKKIAFTNVYVGEVYICAGQSNMDTLLGQYEPHKPDVASANDEKLRLFNVDKFGLGMSVEIEPLDKMRRTAVWAGANPDSAKAFSATGYIFGRRMREKLDMPIGLVSTAIGGSQIAYWLPRNDIAKLVQKWNGEMLVFSGKATSMVDGNGFNGMIHPIRRLKVRGVVWYQGETDAMNIYVGYEDALNQLIASWRTAFDNPDMIWTIIELPRFQVDYAPVRRMQQNVARADNRVCMSVAIDLGDWHDIHPANKTVIATRAADETLYNFYGVNSNRFPRLVKYEKLSPSKIKLTFVNVGAGLEILNHGVGFELWTERGTSIKEGVTITLSENKKSIIVDSPNSNEICELEYGASPLLNESSYHDVSSQISLYNTNGLPVDQFYLKLDKYSQ